MQAEGGERLAAVYRYRRMTRGQVRKSKRDGEMVKAASQRLPVESHLLHPLQLAGFILLDVDHARSGPRTISVSSYSPEHP